ncbi:LodA/GoxA family CTQ-dependent oxidase [Streptomyces sp. NPDC006458]|uniref:LodA/GoxA family CTQ-dependent oxidase n=1 Tax=Streptomyces sp. NPDC006458 TaxID=3154302 RepID=UPI0033B07EAA
MPDLPPPGEKIFPRNLTARADHIVRGNPSGTRPESGVDNCFPGLEFDQRNMDKRFLPGLVVDFHRGEGSRVLEITGGVPEAEGLTNADLPAERPLYVWAVCGRTTVDQTDGQVAPVDCRGASGLLAWRAVHDLLPGPIAVLIGPGPGDPSTGSTAVAALDQQWAAGDSFVLRGPNGRVRLAVLVADRAEYLTEDGVIDPRAYEPGDLTRSMCAPWQYDFRDCMCFYWASSKPDVTSSADGSVPQMNFLRADRTPVPDLDNDDSPPNQEGPRRRSEFTYSGLIQDWNVLPVVLNDREDDSIGLVEPPPVTLLDRPQVIDKLRTLATVEHALCMEYLYAHYSLNAPRELPATPQPSRLTRAVHRAGQEVFQVAVDEMRHLRWVNEALGTLGQQPVVGRAAEIMRGGETHTVERRLLTAEQLQWFIDVESPSQDQGTGVDGMYVQLHQSLVRQKDLFPEHDRLSHLIKLIIDEGGDHFRRFTAVKRHLSPFTPAQYLRPLGAGDGSPLQTQLLTLSDQYYALLLGLLNSTFALQDRAGGVLIEQSRVTMENLHQINHMLAARDVGPRFTLPAAFAQPAALGAADGQVARSAALAAIEAQQEIRALADLPTRRIIIAQQTQTESMLSLLDA